MLKTKNSTNLEVSAEVVDGDEALVLHIQGLEAVHKAVDLLLGEVEGHVALGQALDVQPHLTPQVPLGVRRLCLYRGCKCFIRKKSETLKNC